MSERLAVAAALVGAIIMVVGSALTIVFPAYSPGSRLVSAAGLYASPD